VEASSRRDAWIALARAWAGPERLALIVSGSHARGDAVWAEVTGRTLSLSDLDLYAVVPDRAAQRAARRRAAADRPGLKARLDGLGLAASLEVAFLTPADLAGLPARPGTLELKRHGRVVEGDPGWLARVPDWGARDVSAEETLLLLENRAFELLDARPGLARPELLARLKARHAVLKSALDLAVVECLAAGEYPDDAAARVARARARARSPEPPWDAALAWRAGRVEALDERAGEREWLATAVGWVARWRDCAPGRTPGAAGPAAGTGGGDPARVRRAAGRASLRRRARAAVSFAARGGAGPGLLDRLRYWARGTPQHRLGASAAVMILRATAGPDAPDDWRAALAWLGVVRRPGEATQAERELVRCWDRWVLDGQRTTEGA
jgi:predicted nucleotidyltransferase